VLSEWYYRKAAFIKATGRKQLPLVQLLLFKNKSRYKKQNQTHPKYFRARIWVKYDNYYIGPLQLHTVFWFLYRLGNGGARNKM
jgi:hypothetical protein